MIPVRLKVRNFMCYRDNVPALEFNDIHVACLSGDNGNGKSALIDAITWALWGKTRAGSDDDLIHTTQNEMEVEFDFSVDGQIYRILRKRTRPKRRGGPGQPSLDLHINAGDSFRTINGNVIAETQQKIIEILHMDYDTFINSAYLRQGHADEFTRQASAKRKEVLGNILGLSLYDELSDRARELARHYEGEKLQMENSIREINEELSRKPEYEEELTGAQEEFAEVDVLTREKETKRNELRQKKEALENTKKQLEELETRLNNSARDLQRWNEQLEQLKSRIKEYEDLIDRRDTIEEGFAEFNKAREMNETLEQRFRQSVALEKQRTQLEAKITEAGHNLTTEHTVAQKEVAGIEEKLQRLPELKNHLSQVQTKLRGIAEAEEDIRKKEQDIQELQAQINFLEAENSRLERDITELTEKLDLISSHSESHANVKCPLCESELTQEGLELIETKYTKEKSDKSELLVSNGSDLDGKREKIKLLREVKSSLEKETGREKTALQGQESVHVKEIKDIEESEKRLVELKETVDIIEQKLVKKDFALTEQAAMAAVETELAGLGYDVAKHEEVKQQLERMKSFEYDMQKLNEAVNRIEQEKEAVGKAEEAISGLQNSLKEDSRKKESMTGELTQLPQITGESAQVETEYQELRTQLNRAQEKIGSVKSKIQRCAELEARKKEREEQLATNAKEESIYRDLAKSFGKTGVQALLIEIALPEVESEANLLLGRMTDNRMHVKFDTQRETKRGTVQETLDINIADELGTRNYEMFSGGEAFRINFAIRIALSRLLAKRAGARLPTLIIDEGFGTQDNTGIEKLKEVINSIQEDFEKILVITHMDDLKDAFPTRIDVIKGAEGSTISVN